ncbi:FHIPEP family type III secretion protein, partial [Escherichia coli]|uniref:FHIPEP family type III secretion protein n=1 Tax=Escherichia coli TaxID=562 RepID=UPI0015729674
SGKRKEMRSRDKERAREVRRREMSSEREGGMQMVKKKIRKRRGMVLRGAGEGLEGVVPGMGKRVLVEYTEGGLGLAWRIGGREKKGKAEPKPEKMAEEHNGVEERGKNGQMEDALRMEDGYRLITMVDFHQDDELLARKHRNRKKFAQEMGFLPPEVHIRDNMDLEPA